MADARRHRLRAQGLSYRLAPAKAVFVFSKPAATSSAPASTGLLGADRWSGSHDEVTATLRMELLGADPAARSAVDAPLPGNANFLVGDDPGRWRSGIPTYGKVTYQAVYAGVDVTYHGNPGQLEYDFIVAPGVDPSVVELAFRDAQALRVDEGGDLLLTVAGTELRHHAPVIYQDSGGARARVAGNFVVRDTGNVGFAVGNYDRTRPLVIDPTLAYSSFLGGAGFDSGLSVAVNQVGEAYVAGAPTRPTSRPPRAPTTPASTASSGRATSTPI